MANIQQVWESQDGWKALGLRYYVRPDFDKQPDISGAFDLVISARSRCADWSVLRQLAMGKLKAPD